MKISHLLVTALAAAAGCTAGCGSGCGGTNVNANSNTPMVSCNPSGTGGAATVLQNGLCVPVSPTNSQ